MLPLPPKREPQHGVHIKEVMKLLQGLPENYQVRMYNVDRAHVYQHEREKHVLRYESEMHDPGKMIP